MLPATWCRWQGGKPWSNRRKGNLPKQSKTYHYIINYPSRIRPNSSVFVGECCSKSYHWDPPTARPPWCCGRGNLQAPHRAMRLRQSWLRRRCTSRVSWEKTMGSRSLGVKAPKGGPMDSWTCPKKHPFGRCDLRFELQFVQTDSGEAVRERRKTTCDVQLEDILSAVCWIPNSEFCGLTV